MYNRRDFNSREKIGEYGNSDGILSCSKYRDVFTGIYGFITRRNMLAVLISLELILNAVNINFVVFNRYLYPGKMEGMFFLSL